MVSAATFIVNYPEFTNAPPALITNELTNAYNKTSATVWGVYIDEGAQLRACRSLALSPFGRGMALVSKDGSTVYDERLNDLIEIIAAGGSLL